MYRVINTILKQKQNTMKAILLAIGLLATFSVKAQSLPAEGAKEAANYICLC
jgi:hypothetical protein